MRMNFGRFRRCKMTYKASKYNYATQNEHGDYLICNLIAGINSLQTIPASSKALVELMLGKESVVGEELIPEIEKYAKMGFFVGNDIDEMFTIKTLYDEKVNSNLLNLIIMTTGQCNFRCKSSLK